jgi:hypothetical protein
MGPSRKDHFGAAALLFAQLVEGAGALPELQDRPLLGREVHLRIDLIEGHRLHLWSRPESLYLSESRRPCGTPAWAVFLDGKEVAMPRTRLALVLFLAAAPALSQPPVATPKTQVRFAGPSGLHVRWYYKTADGKEGFSEPPLEAPARYNFAQGGVYRLKLSQIPGFPGLELYPTLEVRHAAGPAAQQFLDHNAVPLELTADDIQQAADGKNIVKTVYLPGGQGGAGPALLVLRMGNLDLEGAGPAKK